MAFTTTSDFTNEIISEIENKIGYRFTDKDKLVQAFVRSSYRQIGNNEILEFFGDTALGLVIVKKMAESYTYPEIDPEWLSKFNKNSKQKENNRILSDYTEGEMTEIKKTLVSTGALSAAIDRLGLSEYLVMSAGDVKSAVDREPSVREDLFEAIVGAIAIDSGWNTDRLTEAVDAMLDPDPVIAKGYQISEDYVGIAARMVESEPIYEVEETDRGYEASVHLDCYKRFSTFGANAFTAQQPEKVMIDMGDGNKKPFLLIGNMFDEFKVYGFGKTEESAKQAAAQKFIEFIELQRNIVRNLSGKNPGECVSMLNELKQKSIIEEPEYKIHCLDKKTELGNPVWECTVFLGKNNWYTDVGYTKQAAKNNAAMRAIYSLLRFDSFMLCYGDPNGDIRQAEFADLIKKFSKEIKI